MSRRVNSANRAALALLGLLLTAAGGLGLATGFGAFGRARADSPVLPGRLRTFATDTPWFWWAVAAACVLIALLGLRWLLAQLRVDRLHRLDLTTDERDGLTTLHAGALTDAVQDEVRGIRGVSGASAHLRSEPSRRLVLAVDLADYADIADVRRRLEQDTVSHVRQAIDDPGFPVDIELRPGQHAGRGLR
jgi:hypothetical protein